MNVKRIVSKFAKRKKNVLVPKPDVKEEAFTNKHPAYKKYDIGDYTYGFPQIFDYADYDDIATKPTKLKIGKFCSIGTDVKIILGSEHRTDWVTTYPFNALFTKFRHIKGHPHTKGDIIIGNDVWIGTNVTILSGIAIGDGSVIGANSLVTKSIGAYSLAAGVPAKHIKYRFSVDIITRLEKIKWWDLPFSEIEAHMELLLSSNISAFIEQLESKNK